MIQRVLFNKIFDFGLTFYYILFNVNVNTKISGSSWQMLADSPVSMSKGNIIFYKGINFKLEAIYIMLI